MQIQEILNLPLLEILNDARIIFGFLNQNNITKYRRKYDIIDDPSPLAVTIN